MPRALPPRVVLVNRCFIIREDGAILIVKRSSIDRHNPGKWEVPGGKVDQGQELEHARNREVIEETGLAVKLFQPLTYSESRMIEGGPYKGFLYLAIFSVCTPIGGNLKLSEEHDDYAWLAYQRLIMRDLTDEVRSAAIALREYLI